MADELQKPETDTQSQPDAALTTDKQTEEKTVPYSRFKEVNDKLRDIEKQLTAQKTAAEQAEALRLKEQGDFKKLYEQTAEKLPVLETKAQQAEAYEKWFQDTLTTRLKTVPSHIRALLEKQAPLDALRWLEDNAQELQRNPGSRSNLDGQARDASSVLTDAEQQTIKAMGISEASYLRARNIPKSPFNPK